MVCFEMKWKRERPVDTCFKKIFCCLPLRWGCLIIGIIGVLAGIADLWIRPGHWYHTISGIALIVSYGTLIVAAIVQHERTIYVHIYMAGLVGGGIIVVLVIVGTLAVTFAISVFVPPFNDDCKREIRANIWEIQTTKHTKYA